MSGVSKNLKNTTEIPREDAKLRCPPSGVAADFTDCVPLGCFCCCLCHYFSCLCCCLVLFVVCAACFCLCGSCCLCFQLFLLILLLCAAFPVLCAAFWVAEPPPLPLQNVKNNFSHPGAIILHPKKAHPVQKVRDVVSRVIWSGSDGQCSAREALNLCLLQLAFTC